LLKNLYISNYALIDRLQVNWDSGFTVITGETGSGKSILLGALGLLTGDRADSKVLRKKEEKCVVEGEFDLSKLTDIASFFDQNDIDFSQNCLLRREINTQGKSRSFINDTPVTLQALKELGDRLIDIHSQHENFLLNDKKFVSGIIDASADTLVLLHSYQAQYTTVKHLTHELNELQLMAEDAQKEKDYLLFQLNEFEGVSLQELEKSDLEEEYNKLVHAEEIKSLSSEIVHYLDEAPSSVLGLLTSMLQVSGKIAGITATGQGLHERLDTIRIELKDMLADFQRLQASIEVDNNKLARLDELMAVIHRLQKKHHLSSIKELMAKQTELGDRLSVIGNVDDKIRDISFRLDKEEKELWLLGEKLSKERAKVYGKLENTLNELLVKMNMPNARVNIHSTVLKTPSYYGIEEIMFYAKTNLGAAFEPLKKIASGGELSRVMLAIKSLQTQSSAIPTLVFDEIDTGVSGEVAHAMGQIMKGLSRSVQIISITHLAQIAGKGNHHFKVYKEDANAVTQTRLIALSGDQRVMELAEMISGKNPSDTALATARELLSL
jgi:DNA repair protein RecN (Recombination protein N)